MTPPTPVLSTAERLRRLVSAARAVCDEPCEWKPAAADIELGAALAAWDERQALKESSAIRNALFSGDLHSMDLEWQSRRHADETRLLDLIDSELLGRRSPSKEPK